MTDPRQRRQEQQLTLIAMQATRLPSMLHAAWEATELTLPDGYPTGGNGEHVAGGDVPRPTEHAVLERERVLESVEDHHNDEARIVGLASVDASLRVAVQALREVHDALSQLTARLHHGQAEQRTNMADCSACERPVANTPVDRIKAGYCEACYKAWTRAGRPDRAGFERTRSVEPDDVPTVHTSGSTTVDLTVAGVTVRLPTELAIEWHQLEAPTTDDVQRLHAQAVELGR